LSPNLVYHGILVI